jgi:hypothetical protein
VFQKQQSVIDHLGKTDPQAWLTYIRGIEQGNTAPDISMLVVFGFAAPRAKEQLSLDWAEVAVRAAELEARASGGVERNNAEADAMRLRTWFICRLGPRDPHFVLDQPAVLRWIEDGLDLPLDAATLSTQTLWKDLAKARNSDDPTDLQQVARRFSKLRDIKHRLDLASRLADSGHLDRNTNLDQWLKIRELLP